MTFLDIVTKSWNSPIWVLILIFESGYNCGVFIDTRGTLCACSLVLDAACKGEQPFGKFFPLVDRLGADAFRHIIDTTHPKFKFINITLVGHTPRLPLIESVF